MRYCRLFLHFLWLHFAILVVHIICHSMWYRAPFAGLPDLKNESAKLRNITHIIPEFGQNTMHGFRNTPYEGFGPFHSISNLDRWYKLQERQCQHIMNDPKYMENAKYLQNESAKLDLILYGIAFDPWCLLMLADFEKNTSLLALSTYKVLPEYFEIAGGGPPSPVLMPHLITQYNERMHFYQHALTTILYTYKYYFEFKRPAEYIGPIMKANSCVRDYGIPTKLANIMSRIKLILANSHPAMEYAQSLPPNIDYQMDIDKLRESGEPDEIRDLLFNAIFGSRYPQIDILANPKVKLFITEADYLNIQNAIYHGVPLIVMPLNMDQLNNTQRIVEHGFGQCLVHENITVESLYDAISNTWRCTKCYHDAQMANQPLDSAALKSIDAAIGWIEKATNLDPASYDYLTSDAVSFIVLPAHLGDAYILLAIVVLCLIAVLSLIFRNAITEFAGRNRFFRLLLSVILWLCSPFVLLFSWVCGSAYLLYIGWQRMRTYFRYGLINRLRRWRRRTRRRFDEEIQLQTTGNTDSQQTLNGDSNVAFESAIDEEIPLQTTTNTDSQQTMDDDSNVERGRNILYNRQETLPDSSSTPVPMTSRSESPVPRPSSDIITPAAVTPCESNPSPFASPDLSGSNIRRVSSEVKMVHVMFKRQNVKSDLIESAFSSCDISTSPIPRTPSDLMSSSCERTSTGVIMSSDVSASPVPTISPDPLMTPNLEASTSATHTNDHPVQKRLSAEKATPVLEIPSQAGVSPVSIVSPAAKVSPVPMESEMRQTSALAPKKSPRARLSPVPMKFEFKLSPGTTTSPNTQTSPHEMASPHLSGPLVQMPSPDLLSPYTRKSSFSLKLRTASANTENFFVFPSPETKFPPKNVLLSPQSNASSSSHLKAGPDPKLSTPETSESSGQHPKQFLCDVDIHSSPKPVDEKIRSITRTIEDTFDNQSGPGKSKFRTVQPIYDEIEVMCDEPHSSSQSKLGVSRTNSSKTSGRYKSKGRSNSLRISHYKKDKTLSDSSSLSSTSPDPNSPGLLYTEALVRQPTPELFSPSGQGKKSTDTTSAERSPFDPDAYCLPTANRTSRRDSAPEYAQELSYDEASAHTESLNAVTPGLSPTNTNPSSSLPISSDERATSSTSTVPVTSDESSSTKKSSTSKTSTRDSLKTTYI